MNFLYANQLYLTENNPWFSYEIKRNNRKLKNIDISEAIILENFISEAIDKFKILTSNENNIVTYYFINFIKIGIEKILLQKNNDKIIFPNGCCTSNNCRINLMYEIIFNLMFEDDEK